ncbi:ATP-binding protein [Pseudomonas sp. R11-23-07]|uniref:ATP-binding protein n=1 Tax=Pseudomonas sp. R11-23-07 TaxID=658632 RepID=UPI000F55D24E|nr:ATP-binding protein [Pseudomonas sp. R11-23-07]
MNKISCIEFDASRDSHPYVGIWPFSADGFFPSDIFPPQHLYDVVFKLWPAYFNCPAATVRRAIRAHLKRYAPQALKTTHRDTIQRDTAMANAFATLYSSRIRAKELTFHRESLGRFGRVSKKNSVLEPGSTFGELIGHSYHEDSELNPLFRWFLDCAQPRHELERERYLTGELLSEGFKKTPCPKPVDSIEFARLVLVYASLSKSFDEQVLLVETAQLLGCTHLNGLARVQFEGGESIDIDCEDVGHNIEQPKLMKGVSKSSDEWPPDSDSLRYVEEFDSAISALFKSKELVAEWDGGMISDLITIPDDRWRALSSAVQEARESSKNVVKCRLRVQEQDAAQWELILDRVGAEQTWSKHVPASDEELVASFLLLCRIKNALDELKPSFNQLEVWKGSLGGVLNLSKLEGLINSISAENGDRCERSSFRESFNEYLKALPPALLRRCILGLDGVELSSLIDPDGNDRWLVGDAILIRAALDKTSMIPSSVMDVILAAVVVEKRRALLHFIDPSSAVLKTNLTFRRVVAVERFRDIFLFEPVAQILDPSSGLNDVELVGRNVYELAELISVNSSLLSTGADVSRLIRQCSNDERACSALKEFANAPVTMRGNFRRLKEKARDKLLKTAFKNDEPVVKQALVLIEDIQSENFTDGLFFELQEERPDDSLEQRHREQLTRYVSQMDRLLRDFVSEVQHRPDVRLKSVASKLRKLHRQLRSSDEIGSLEWLEGQVAELLSNPASGNSIPTLRGKSEDIEGSRWTSENTLWATDFIELPEFYFEASISSWDVAVASLYWRALGNAPEGMQIAKKLLEYEEYQGAIKFAKELNDKAVSSYVLDAVSPQVDALALRVGKLIIEHGDSTLEGIEEYNLYKSALDLFDLTAASEHLELLELITTDINKVVSFDSNQNQERRLALLRYFGLIGTTLEDPVPIDAQLEMLWLSVMNAHSLERLHLTVVEKALDNIDNATGSFASVISTFKEGNQNPDRWLPSDTAADFSDFVREPAEVLASWARSAPMYISSEQRASYIVCEWFIGFVVERSRSIHQLEEADSLNSAMDRIFEVSAIIVNALRPALCLTQLRETGEVPHELVDLAIDQNGTGDDNHYSNFGKRRLNAQNEPGEDSSEASLEVMRLVKREQWLEASEICARFDASGSEKATSLFNMTDVFQALSDEAEKPSVNLVDKLASAATWLSTHNEYTTLLPESRRVDLAFRVLSGVVAADSGDEMTRVPATNGAWTEILGRSSPFRKMLVTGVEYRVEKVLEALLTGCLSIQIAERLWDAATNINDPHTYRTPLLTFLYEHGASDALSRLAAKFDPAIAARLSQLFELRLVASNRPDLIPVAQSVADQVVTAAKSLPFRTFVKELPTAAQVVKPNLSVECEGELCLRDSTKGAVFELPIVVTPQGLVPVKLEATLFDGDDAVFEEDTLRSELSSRPLYFASEFTLRIKFGSSWFVKGSNPRDSVRVRVRAKTVTDEFFVEDIVCRVRSYDSRGYSGTDLNTDTLLDIYPGVSNTPAVEEAFIGRHDELECLNQVLVSARRPSPVLLTGMRRIGKTSLLFAFHNRLRQPGNSTAISFYLSLAERRVEFVDHDRSVSATIFRAISHGLVRPNLSATDQNHALCTRIRQKFDGDWKAARKAIQECFDEESLSDSLIALSEKILDWTGAPSERFILLIDEAEALVAPYQAGGNKRLELEQLLQSLREISQTTGSIGILLSGSNHINVFAREYKNAFFGSSQLIELAGLKDAKEAAALIAPHRVSIFVQFETPAIEYAFSLCAGMPQFLWQVGATVAHLVRSGAATKKDVRMAVAALVGERKAELPFKSYEILEPIDSMLALESARERDLLWMLLYRIANASSLVAEDATVPFVIDHALAALEERSAWNRRLRALVDLKILRMDSSSTIRFQVPLFAEGFRAKKYWQEYNIRLQGVAV